MNLKAEKKWLCDFLIRNEFTCYETDGGRTDSIGSFGIDNSLHLTALAGSLMKTLNPLRRNTAAIKWTFNASRNCEGHGLFQFLSGRPISTGPGRTQLTKLLLVLLAFLCLFRLPSSGRRRSPGCALLIRKIFAKQSRGFTRDYYASDCAFVVQMVKTDSWLCFARRVANNLISLKARNGNGSFHIRGTFRSNSKRQNWVKLLLSVRYACCKKLNVGQIKSTLQRKQYYYVSRD